MAFDNVKQLRRAIIPGIAAAHADLDARMAAVPSVCGAGCDACCYQMVSTHTWEEEFLARRRFTCLTSCIPTPSSPWPSLQPRH